jgi:hypothetical protein
MRVSGRATDGAHQTFYVSMPRFREALFPPGAAAPSTVHEVVHDGPLQAAEFVTKATLSAQGGPKQLRARVWPLKPPGAGVSYFLPSRDVERSPRKRRRRE